MITYVSAHDKSYIGDKLCGNNSVRRIEKKTVLSGSGMYLTCQGIPFLLSERSSHGQKAAGITRIMHRSPSIVWIGNRYTRNKKAGGKLCKTYQTKKCCRDCGIKETGKTHLKSYTKQIVVWAEMWITRQKKKQSCGKHSVLYITAVKNSRK